MQRRSSSQNICLQLVFANITSGHANLTNADVKAEVLFLVRMVAILQESVCLLGVKGHSLVEGDVLGAGYLIG